MCGKSTRLIVVIQSAGKPCGLKAHVYQPLRAARAIPDLSGKVEGLSVTGAVRTVSQINDEGFERGTESGLQACNIFEFIID